MNFIIGIIVGLLSIQGGMIVAALVCVATGDIKTKDDFKSMLKPFPVIWWKQFIVRWRELK